MAPAGPVGEGGPPQPVTNRRRPTLYPTCPTRSDTNRPNSTRNTSGVTEKPLRSIRQIDTRDALPDFRNLGVIARILLATNAAGFAAAALRSQRLSELADQFAPVALVLEPALIATLASLYLLSTVLRRLPYAAGLAITGAIAAAFSAAMAPVAYALGQIGGAWDGARYAAWALVLVGLLAVYFNLRERALSPSLAEARLQALQARIRPHFLFNSLNAVLSLMRRDGRRAETAVEDLADLFRAVMADPRQTVPLADEISLCRQYLNLELLRLGDRLAVEWNVSDDAGAVLVPAMVLQPLMENAVYHGVEPGVERGVITMSANVTGDRLRIELTNPYHPEHQHQQGNRMALDNIRERLRLHYDIEAEFRSGVDGDRYRIAIVLPVHRDRTAGAS